MAEHEACVKNELQGELRKLPGSPCADSDAHTQAHTDPNAEVIRGLITGMMERRLEDDSEGVDQPKAKRRRWAKKYDANRKFQSIWLVKFNWLRYDPDKDMMYCEPCRLVHGCGLGMGTRKFRIDTLMDHERQTKDGRPSKHQRAYDRWQSRILTEPAATEMLQNMLQSERDLTNTLIGHDLHRAMLFKTVYYLISSGRSVNELTHLLPFLKFMFVQAPPENGVDVQEVWEMASIMKDLLNEDLQRELRVGGPFSLIIDDSIVSDGRAYCSLSARFMKDGRVPVEMVLDFGELPGLDSERLKDWLISALGRTGIELDDLRACVGLGSMGGGLKAGVKGAVGTLLLSQCSPFILSVHGHAHRYNLVPSVFYELGVVRSLESLMQSISAVMERLQGGVVGLIIKEIFLSPKFTEVCRPQDVRWLAVSGCNSRFYADYGPLLHVFRDLRASFLEADAIYNQLLSIETLLTTAILHPIIEQLDRLADACHNIEKDVVSLIECLRFTRNFIRCVYLDDGAARKWLETDASNAPESCEADGQPKQNVDVVFPFGYRYATLVSCAGDSPLRFCAHGPTRALLLISGDAHWLSSAGQVVGESELESAKQRVEEQARKVAELVLVDLSDRFPTVDLLEAFSVLDPKFWRGKPCDEEVQRLVDVLKQKYGRPAMTSHCSVIAPLVKIEQVDAELEHLKLIMKPSGEQIGGKDATMLQFWQLIFQNMGVCQIIPQFVALAKVFMMLPLGGIRNERLFEEMGFLRQSFRQGLTPEQLNTACTIMCNGPHYRNFPYVLAVKKWNEQHSKERSGEED